MDLTAILNGAFGAGVILIVGKIIDAFSNRNKTRADAAKVIVEGGAQAVNTMRELLNDYDRINDEQAAEIKELKAHLKERDKVNATRDAEFADLLQKYEDLEAQNIIITNKARATDERIQRDTEETQRLRNEYAVARKQIIKLEDLAVSLGEYVDKMMVAVQKAGIDIPLNGELLESVNRLKLAREERRKLSGN